MCWRAPRHTAADDDAGSAYVQRMAAAAESGRPAAEPPPSAPIDDQDAAVDAAVRRAMEAVQTTLAAPKTQDRLRELVRLEQDRSKRLGDARTRLAEQVAGHVPTGRDDLPPVPYRDLRPSGVYGLYLARAYATGQPVQVTMRTDDTPGGQGVRVFTLQADGRWEPARRRVDLGSCTEGARYTTVTGGRQTSVHHAGPGRSRPGRAHREPARHG